METTSINKSELLEKLKTNRDEHKTEFEKAKAAWKKKAAKALSKAAKKAEDDGVITLNPLIKLPKPQHYMDSYDQVINRLEVETKDTVELTAREFEAYWMNNWDWRGQFVAGTSLYNNTI